jgi:hypothetical protein
VICLYRVLNCAFVQLHLNHVAAGRFHRFLDSYWHFARFTATETHFAFAITNNCQGCETENTATFYHLGYTVDLNQFLLEITFLLLLSLIVKRHSNTLEFQSTFTGGIGQSLDASVVLVSTAVKSNGVDTGYLGTLCDKLAHGCGRFSIACVTATQTAVQGRGAGQYRVASRRYNLGINMPGSTVHAQAINTEAFYMGASATGATQP